MLIIHPIFIYSHQCKLPYPKPWCGRVELNHRHMDFQSIALPPELLPHNCQALYIVYFEHASFQPHWTPIFTLPYPSAGIIIRFRFALYEVLVGFSLHFFVLGTGFEPVSHAWKAHRLDHYQISQHLFSTAKIMKIFEISKSFLVSFNKFQSIHPYPSHDESIASK